MIAASTSAPAISDPLTWAEICDRYPEQWVCVVDIDRVAPNSLEFRTARVVGHGVTRREPLDQARPWRSRFAIIGHYFTGSVIAPVERFLP
jgi:hypothetical protein